MAEPEFTSSAEPEAEVPEVAPAFGNDEIIGLAEHDGLPSIELLLPAIVGVTALTAIVTFSSMLKTRHLSKQYIDSEGRIIRPWKELDKPNQQWTPLLSSADIHIIYRLVMFPFSTKSLLLMCMPSLLSFSFLPVGTVLRNPAIKLMWPDGSFYDAQINDVIACFLIPAGLVYAIAFGFAFEQAARSQEAYHKWLISHYVLTRRQIVMLSKLNVDVTEKMEIIQLITRSILSCCTSIMTGLEEHTTKASDQLIEIEARFCDTKERMMSDDNKKTQIKMCDILTEITKRKQLEVKMLDTLRSDMNFCLWFFLEMLGYFAYLGILLVDAKSFRMEITMCFCTVFSISMFSFILGDLNAPFHGIFRISLAPLLEMFRHLEEKYIELVSTGKLTTSSQQHVTDSRNSEQFVRV